jgi:hypothetical protein
MAFYSTQICVHNPIFPGLRTKGETSRADTHQCKILLGVGPGKGIDTSGQPGNFSGRIAFMDCTLAGGPIDGGNCQLESNLRFLGRILLNGNPNCLDGTFKHGFDRPVTATTNQTLTMSF